MKRSFVAERGEKTVVDFLAENMESVSVKNIKKQLKLKEIRINGIRICENEVLRAGDRVEIFIPSFMENVPDIKIIYSDKNVAVADKPVMCGTETTLTDFMRSVFPSARPVHRLDMNTTGLVVFALNDAAYNELSEIFRNRTIEKYYSALVYGAFERKKDVLTAYLKKDSDRAVCEISATPKNGFVKIVTEYETQEIFESYSKIKVKLVTGKTHQIRAHLAFEGHPVLGDNKYGKNEINRCFPYKFQQLRAVSIKFPSMPAPLENLSEKEISV